MAYGATHVGGWWEAINCLVGHTAVEHATAEGEFKIVI